MNHNQTKHCTYTHRRTNLYDDSKVEKIVNQMLEMMFQEMPQLLRSYYYYFIRLHLKSIENHINKNLVY